jgi:competence protein ComEC
MDDRAGGRLLTGEGRVEPAAEGPVFEPGPTSPAASLAARARRAGLYFVDSLGRELDGGRGFLWLPVSFAIGILIYFIAPREPSAAALATSLAIAAVIGLLARTRFALFRFMIVVAFMLAGTTAMKLRTDWVAAPKLAREMTTDVTGWVAERAMSNGGGVRVVLRVHSIAEVAPEEQPRFVRVTIRSNTDAIAVGDAISVTARLQPPGGPVIPGGYDFARAAYYEGLGGVGFAYGAARPAGIGPPPLSIRLAMPLAHLREAIRKRVMEALPGDNGKIAAAMIMGDQGGISEVTQEAMRTSGLGHILSISGLHMVLIAGAAYSILRALFALSPGLALRRPIKKWAAVGGLVVATFYLGLSGAEVATERAYLMLVIMFVAVLLDRRAITLRNVALAALAILVVSPESLMSASFQMSFPATIALVAAYEEISARADHRLRLTDRRDAGWAGRAWRLTTGLVITSLVAGLATTPFGIYHFQRVAPLTLFANVLATPAVGALVMPMVGFTVLVMPLGLEIVPLTIMNWGIAWMVAVAGWAVEWSGEAGGVRMMPALSLLLIVGGFLWLALWRERWRLLGIVPILAAILIAGAAPAPDIVVNEEGTSAAVRAPDGRYAIVGGRRESFAVENWLRADGDPRKPDTPDLAEGVHCDALGCIAATVDGKTLALVRKPDAFAEDCRLAAIVVSRLETPPYCAETAFVIDRDPLARRGAHALYRETNEAGEPFYRVETAYPAVPRPWMPAFNSGE